MSHQTQLSEPVPIASSSTLFLTQILVFYEDAVRLLRVRDTYDWHQRVWQAFGGRDGQPRDFLIRIDRIEESFRVLILSHSQPARPNWCPIDCFSTKPVPEAFFHHGAYRFSLLANPTKKIRVLLEDGSRRKNGRRVPLTSTEDLTAWINRKALAGGFALYPESLRVIPKGREYFHKPDAHGTHTAVEFTGLLRVTDLKLFRETFGRGIGSAKGFGFGMLVIAPLKTNSN
jgi:CRISPR system Cascade subunit CasE